ncbi:peptidoglycan editing factor PgeF [Roseococcus sp. SYP-B2431]|uniref:peptidoglycan editing factor PgeF n=1 Tax=Roseococcus sp. SYP-B2431 TaxID=2496640 RepID=UPI00103BF757|nr:peptidoglycan editing factor PgeF [Roseococcus sp. SYP-B2431]TCH99886.1 peptidoglycan editing factor PgeF [Roseococcus sp. SYP-B2431]
MAEFLTHPALAARHGFFTRRGGVSTGAYAELNCGLRGDDPPANVAENRARAARALGVEPADLRSLRQVHGPRVVEATGAAEGATGAAWDALPEADGLVTRAPGLALGVITADCAPALFHDAEAGVIGAAHAGWRGAVGGVLEATVEAMVALGADRHRVNAVIGPCIAKASYEVRADLRDAVGDPRFFAPGRDAGHFQFDLAGYCVARLRAAGVAATAIGLDTLTDEARFFSHRRRTLAGGGPLGHQISAIVL